MGKALIVPKGTKFGNLTVIEEAERNAKNERQFLCKCDCGNEKVLRLTDLRAGHSKTCGCRNLNLRTISVDDYIGRRYGRLVVIGPADNQTKGKTFKVKCRCDCGSVKDYALLNLNNKRMPTRSCGCARGLRDGIKSRSREALYRTYGNMKARCYNPNIPNYHNYGGRGIKVCDEWLNDYASFRAWAYENGYKPGCRGDLTLDRIDNNGDYGPSNCRWVNMKVQSNNKRGNIRITYNGETHTATEWSEIVGIPDTTLRERYKRGFPLDLVFSKEKLCETTLRDYKKS